MSIGKIVQVIGAVGGHRVPLATKCPKFTTHSFLKKDENNKLAEEGLTFEVQQQLGDGVVRNHCYGFF